MAEWCSNRLVVKNCSNKWLAALDEKDFKLESFVPKVPDQKIDHWGTWGPVGDFEVVFGDDYSGKVEVAFDTKYCPPCQWLVKMSALFKGVEFELYYAQSGAEEFFGWTKAKDGAYKCLVQNDVWIDAPYPHRTLTTTFCRFLREHGLHRGG